MTKAEEAALKAYPIEMTPLNYQDLIDQFGGKTEIDVNTYPRHLFQEGYKQAEKDLLEVSDMKSPFTGGKVLRGMEKKTITFRGEEYIVPQRFFKCQDSGKEFTNAAIEDDNIWEVIKAYFNRKEISPFDLIALTWEDIDKIIQLWLSVLDEMDGTKQELYTKIAELFNESRK